MVLLASIVLFAMTGTRRGVFLPLGGCLIATLWTFAAMAAVGDALAEVLPAVFGYVMEHGLAMAGPPVVRYVDTSPAFVSLKLSARL